MTSFYIFKNLRIEILSVVLKSIQYKQTCTQTNFTTLYRSVLWDTLVIQTLMKNQLRSTVESGIKTTILSLSKILLLYPITLIVMSFHTSSLENLHGHYTRKICLIIVFLILLSYWIICRGIEFTGESFCVFPDDEHNSMKVGLGPILADSTPLSSVQSIKKRCLICLISCTIKDSYIYWLLSFSLLQIFCKSQTKEHKLL